MSPSPSTSSRRKAALGALLLGALLLTLAFLPVDRLFQEIAGRMVAAGPWGIAGYAVFYIVCTVAMLPGSVLTLLGGLVYGPLWGLLLVSPVSVAAATLSFVIGRFLARDAVTRLVKDHPRFSALDQAVARDGFRVVLLLRLSPLFPFNLLNYGLGLTRIRLRDYVLASWLGMLPGTFLYVYLGSMIRNLADVFSGGAPESGWGGKLLLYGGLVATAAVVVMVTRSTRKLLEERLSG